jgi:hypothetical protein
MWNNDLQEFINCGSLVYDNKNRIGFVGFAYDESYIEAGYPAIDPAHMQVEENGGRFIHRKMDGSLFPYFKEFLPGEFGNQLLMSVNKRWAKLSQTEKLYLMSLAYGDYSAAQLNPHNDQHNQVITDLNELGDLVQAIRDYQEGIVSNIVTTEIQGALCSLKGIRPKIDFEDRSGKVARRMVAKLNYSGLYNDARISATMTKMQQSCDIKSCDSIVKSLNCGEDVLLSRNYARTEFYHPESKHESKLLIKYNRMSIRRLLEGDPIMDQSERVKLSHIMHALNKYSSDPEADKEEAFRRTLFDIATNHTSNGLDNWEMYDTGCGHWRLSPAYSNLPNPYQAAEFEMGFLEERSARHLIQFDAEFIKELAEICSIDDVKALAIGANVVQAVANFEKHAMTKGVSAEDTKLLAKTLQTDKLQALVNNISDMPGVRRYIQQNSNIPIVEEIETESISISSPRSTGPSM